MRGVRRVLGVATVLVALASPAAGSASTFLPWGSEGRIDRSQLVGLSCPSASLCVAIDSVGNVLTSGAPTAGRSTWRAASIDSARRLSGVSCPSVSFCVAVDLGGDVFGDVFVSSDPAGGPAAWTRSSSPAGLAGLSCPSSSLCAAGGTGGVFVSDDPAGGVSAWTEAAGADIGPECGKEGGECSPATWTVSCASSSMCVAGDTYGRLRTSTDPMDTSAWVDESLAGVGEYDALSCPSDSLCVAACPPTSALDACPGAGGSSDAEVAWNPLVGLATPEPYGLPRKLSVLSPMQVVVGMWCVSSSLCFASDAVGDLLVSTDPNGTPATWTPAFSATETSDTPVVGLSCLSPSRCVAVDQAGELFVGSPPATRAQTRHLLLTQLLPTGPDATIGALIRHNGYRSRFTAPAAGSLRISWYRISPRTRTRRSSYRTLIAASRDTFEQAAITTLRIGLTRTARRVLQRTREIAITARARFTPAWGEAITVSKTFELKT
jgi:hypothetical protein